MSIKFSAAVLLAAVTITGSSAMAQYGRSYGNSSYQTVRSHSSSRGPSISLQRHVNRDGRFEAKMPTGTRSVTVPGEPITSTKYIAKGEASGATFTVRVQVISPIDLGDENLNRGLRDNFISQARDQHKKSFGRDAKEAAVSQHGMKGQEFLYRIPANQARTGRASAFRQRVMFDGMRLYIATLSGDESTVTSSSGEKFMASVRAMQK